MNLDTKELRRILNMKGLTDCGDFKSLFYTRDEIISLYDSYSVYDDYKLMFDITHYTWDYSTISDQEFDDCLFVIDENNKLFLAITEENVLETLERKIVGR